LGFPTANLVEIATEIPLDGVYAGRTFWQGRYYRAAINVGPNPTFAEHQRKFEVHLLDFQGDLYQQWLDVEFVTRLRSTQPFASVGQLTAQLQLDIQAVRRLVSV
jgi:riboflavin kinase / FMN adenylyltransferase